MADISDAETFLYENLKDAGCGGELAEKVVGFIKHGQRGAALTLLLKHRKAVLDNCHAEQQKIDCLDYLVYRLEKAEF